jgi:SAM-dependent methyltransferase
MPFAKHVSNRVSEHIEETWELERTWSARTPGRSYYDVHVSVIRQHERMAPVFARWLAQRPGGRVLEAGCGTGRWMAYFGTLGHPSVGIDHSPAALRFAKAHAPAFDVCAGDVTALPFRAEAFDCAFSSYVAEHFPDGPSAVLAELHRVLRPDGLLFLVVPFANLWRRLIVHPIFRLRYALWRWTRASIRFTEYHFTRDEVISAVAHAGFAVLECHPDDYYPPWSKGLYCDIADLLGFFNIALREPFRFGRVGTFLLGAAQRLPLWWYCEGIFVVCRRYGDGGIARSGPLR